MNVIKLQWVNKRFRRMPCGLEGLNCRQRWDKLSIFPEAKEAEDWFIKLSGPWKGQIELSPPQYLKAFGQENG